MKIISEEKKAKIKNRHHSIKTQMIMAFVGLLICLVVTLMFINGKFLEPYYISKKESRFIELYEKLNNVSNEDKWNSARKNSSLIHFAEKNNISYLVIGRVYLTHFFLGIFVTGIYVGMILFDKSSVCFLYFVI